MGVGEGFQLRQVRGGSGKVQNTIFTHWRVLMSCNQEIPTILRVSWYSRRQAFLRGCPQTPLSPYARIMRARRQVANVKQYSWLAL